VHGAELAADVLGGAARFLVEREVAAGGGLDEVGLLEGAAEGGEEGLEGGAEAVVDVVA
jgi:hypothetical protein